MLRSDADTVKATARLHNFTIYPTGRDCAGLLSLEMGTCDVYGETADIGQDRFYCPTVHIVFFNGSRVA